MAGEDDEVIVSLTGDTSTMDVEVDGKKVAPTAGETVSFNDDDADPVEDLKKQFNQMSGRVQTLQATHQQTQQQLADTTNRLQRAESAVVVSQIDTIDSGISAAEAEARQAEQIYAQAFEAGDPAAMARAQRAMVRAENNLGRLREARDELQEVAKRQPTEQQRTAAASRQAPADPVEATIANGRLSPRSAAWLRAHPECVTDAKMNARMMAAHNLALADDIAVDSDDYFKRIEAGIKPVVKKDDPKPGNGDGRRPSSGAASGSGSPGGLNGGATTVKLTKGEAQSATDGTLVWNYDDPTGKGRFKKGDPIGLAEMARRKHEGMKAGLYDRNSIEA